MTNKFTQKIIKLNSEAPIPGEVLAYCFFVSFEMEWIFPSGSQVVKGIRYLKSRGEVRIFTVVKSKTSRDDLKEVLKGEKSTRDLFPHLSFKFKIVEEDLLPIKSTKFLSSRVVKLK